MHNIAQALSFNGLAWDAYAGFHCEYSLATDTGNRFNVLQEKVIDETFFFVRALAAAHPYDAARDRMNQRFAIGICSEKTRMQLKKLWASARGKSTE